MSMLAVARSRRAAFGMVALSALTVPVARAQAQAPSHSPARPVPKEHVIPPAPAMWLRTARLVPSDPQTSGAFAQSVAVDGNTIAARQDGNAYVFVRDANGAWTQEAKIVPPTANNSHEETVALDGDNLVIGWPQDDAGGFSSWHGVAWIYHRSGTVWTLEGVAGGLPVAQVGKDAAVVGDVAIITGALPKDAIAVRQRVGGTWNVVQLIDVFPVASSLIYSLAMDATTLVVVTGTYVGPLDNDATRLHFYELDQSGTWTFHQTISVRHAGATDQFGYDVELSGDRVVVGAASDDQFGIDVGSVTTFVREKGTWREETSFGPCDADVLGFGQSIGFVGSSLVVSAYQRVDVEELQTFRGIAYVYELTANGWIAQQTLTIPGTGANGASVAIDDQSLVVGSPSADDPLVNSGALYVFEKHGAVGTNFCFGDGSGSACPCGNEGEPGNGCANAYDVAGARLDAYGTASIADDCLLLSCRGVTPGTSAFFLQGDARELNGFGVPYRDGLRCITGSLVSLGSATSCDGNATFPPAHVPPLSVLGSIPAAGATRYYQVRYSSPGPCGTGTNFTNAVALAWTP